MPNDEKIIQARNIADFIAKDLLGNTSGPSVEQLTHVLSLINVIKSKVTQSLYEKLYVIAPDDCVNWLESWSLFNFGTMTDDQTAPIKAYYEGVVKDAVKVLPQSPLGVTYTIVKLEWRPTGNPGEYRLWVCLNPPVDKRGGGGTGGSSVDPTPPGKP